MKVTDGVAGHGEYLKDNIMKGVLITRMTTITYTQKISQEQVTYNKIFTLGIARCVTAGTKIYSPEWKSSCSPLWKNRPVIRVYAARGRYCTVRPSDIVIYLPRYGFVITLATVSDGGVSEVTGEWL